MILIVVLCQSRHVEAKLPSARGCEVPSSGMSACVALLLLTIGGQMSGARSLLT